MLLAVLSNLTNLNDEVQYESNDAAFSSRKLNALLTGFLVDDVPDVAIQQTFFKLN